MMLCYLLGLEFDLASPNSGENEARNAKTVEALLRNQGVGCLNLHGPVARAHVELDISAGLDDSESKPCST